MHLHNAPIAGHRKTCTAKLQKEILRRPDTKTNPKTKRHLLRAAIAEMSPKTASSSRSLHAKSKSCWGYFLQGSLWHTI